jgi:hypothetical protein
MVTKHRLLKAVIVVEAGSYKHSVSVASDLEIDASPIKVFFNSPSRSVEIPYRTQ